ncbi:MAG: response regulator [Elusimicrobiales bacterium]|nr:response regulator [Elusimicrobiales bacterium]
MAKILIIDDDPDITESMRIILESCRHSVKLAKNGEEGLKEAAAAAYDLVILDVMMETMSKGFEVARALKGVPANAKTPILLLTAIKESTGLDFETEAGDKDWLPVDSYLEKPLKPNELLVKVESLLRK